MNKLANEALQTELYTIETLTELNKNNSNVLPITQRDVDKVNQFVISLNRQLSVKTPQSGDTMILHGKNNVTYHRAHIESAYTNDKLSVCTRPYTPYLYVDRKGKPVTDTSGGYWIGVEPEQATFNGIYELKEFWNFVKGSGASMGVYFKAYVKIFEHTDTEKIY